MLTVDPQTARTSRRVVNSLPWEFFKQRLQTLHNSVFQTLCDPLHICVNSTLKTKFHKMIPFFPCGIPWNFYSISFFTNVVLNVKNWFHKPQMGQDPQCKIHSHASWHITFPYFFPKCHNFSFIKLLTPVGTSR